VKLDSKIILDENGDAVRHEVIWVLRWDSTNHFFFTDYYAHDLYMNKADGTFLHPESTIININKTTMPLTLLYRFSDGNNVLRTGWATYRPSFIEAGTVYTVTIQSNAIDTTPIDNFAEDIETYGFRLPSNCDGNFPCAWFPMSWCSIAPGGNTLRLFNSSHPDGIHSLGTPFGGCNTLYFLYIPILVR